MTRFAHEFERESNPVFVASGWYWKGEKGGCVNEWRWRATRAGVRYPGIRLLPDDWEREEESAMHTNIPFLPTATVLAKPYAPHNVFQAQLSPCLNAEC